MEELFTGSKSTLFRISFGFFRLLADQKIQSSIVGDFDCLRTICLGVFSLRKDRKLSFNILLTDRREIVS